MEPSASVGAAVMIDASLENPLSGDLISKIDTAGNTEWTVEYQARAQVRMVPTFLPIRK